MSEHDPLCPTPHLRRQDVCPYCHVIARARINERKRIAQTLLIENTEDRFTEYQDGYADALIYAAQIARNGGGDD